VTTVFPDAAEVPAALAGEQVDEVASLRRLLEAASGGHWRGHGFVVVRLTGPVPRGAEVTSEGVCR
jgi:hypothetical protein